MADLFGLFKDFDTSFLKDMPDRMKAWDGFLKTVKDGIENLDTRMNHSFAYIDAKLDTMLAKLGYMQAQLDEAIPPPPITPYLFAKNMEYSQLDERNNKTVSYQEIGVNIARN